MVVHPSIFPYNVYTLTKRAYEMNLFEIFENVNGNTFVGVDTRTTVKLTGGKSNPMQGRVEKVMTGANCQVFQNKTCSAYNNMVKRRLEKEGKDPEEFVLSPRIWGTRVVNMPIIEHKGQQYLELIFKTSGEVHYELDGERIDEADIEGLPAKRNYGGQGGLEDQVVIRTFKVANVVNIRIDSKEYTANVAPQRIRLGAVDVTQIDVDVVNFEEA